MKLRFDIVFKRGTREVARVPGCELPEEAANALTVAEVGEQAIQAEQLLEKLTGLRVHIEQVL